MRVLLQRVTQASVTVDGVVCGQIESGLLVLVAFQSSDNPSIMDKMIQKVSQLRIFSDSEGKMNRSIMEVRGEFLVVSQFTLYADCQKGNRPSFTNAAPRNAALELYQIFIEDLERLTNLHVETGIFAAEMQVCLTNDGPVTIWLDSELF